MSAVAIAGERRGSRRGRWIALVIATAACSSRSDDGPLFEQTRTLTLEVTADAPFDRLVLLLGKTGLGAQGVVTPGMLTAGTLPPAASSVYELDSMTRDFDRTTQAARFTFKTPGFRSDIPSAFLAVAYRHDGPDGLVPSSAGMLDLQYSARDGTEFERTLATTAFLLSYVELWGTGKQCGMYNRTAFFVDRADTDCDGIPDPDDCDARVFCDPASTSPAAQAGCNVAKCGRCEVDGAGCALGTRVTCHDVRGQPRTYTCDAGGACGATPVCPPANACQLGCAPAPLDPLPCIARAWADGAQAADAVECQLPTTRTPSGSTPCRGGSVVEVALPFSGCGNPSVVIAYSTSQAARPVVTPPCTLHVTVDTAQPVYRNPLLITMETATGHATVRLTLNPADGDCSAIGACTAVPSAATCEL